MRTKPQPPRIVFRVGSSTLLYPRAVTDTFYSNEEIEQMKLLQKVAIATLITGISLSPTLAFAYGKAGHFHKRFERQQQRIENGVNSGVLTHKEAKSLRREQRKIRRMAREFHDDGVLTGWERRNISKRLNRASDRIWAFKHNDSNRHEHRRHSHSNQDRWNDKYTNTWNWQDNDSYRPGYFSDRYYRNDEWTE